MYLSARKNSLLLQNKNKIYTDFFFFRKYVVFLQTPKYWGNYIKYKYIN